MREAFEKEKRQRSMHSRTAASAHNCSTALGAAVGSVTKRSYSGEPFRKTMLSSFVWKFLFILSSFLH